MSDQKRMKYKSLNKFVNLNLDIGGVNQSRYVEKCQHFRD